MKSYSLWFSLTYFTKYNALKVYPHWCKWQNFFLFYSWIIFHCVNIPYLIYPFILWPKLNVVFMSLLLWIPLQWTWRYRYLFEKVISFPSDKYLEVELLYYIVVLMFWGSSILFSIVTAAIYIPISSCFFFMSFPILISCLYDYSHRCEVITHGFYLHFPDE